MLLRDDVQAAINAARGQLPANLPTNPNWRKVNPADSDFMNLAVTSDTATTPQLYDVAESILAQKISQIAGIGQVNIGGSSRPGVRAELNPLLLSKLAIGLDQVRAALGAANADVPKLRSPTIDACGFSTVTISFFLPGNMLPSSSLIVTEHPSGCRT
jgi:multidrug efflux pump